MEQTEQKKDYTLVAIIIAIVLTAIALTLFMTSSSKEQKTSVVTEENITQAPQEANTSDQAVYAQEYAMAQEINTSTQEDEALEIQEHNDTKQPQETKSFEQKAEEPKLEYEYYKVQKGDTLHKISKKFYGSWKFFARIYTFNNLNNPDLIYAGQILTIPKHTHNPLWDKEQLIQSYIEVYKAYEKMQRTMEVYLMLEAAINYIDQASYKHYRNTTAPWRPVSSVHMHKQNRCDTKHYLAQNRLYA